MFGFLPMMVLRFQVITLRHHNARTILVEDASRLARDLIALDLVRHGLAIGVIDVWVSHVVLKGIKPIVNVKWVRSRIEKDSSLAAFSCSMCFLQALTRNNHHTHNVFCKISLGASHMELLNISWYFIATGRKIELLNQQWLCMRIRHGCELE